MTGPAASARDLAQGSIAQVVLAPERAKRSTAPVQAPPPGSIAATVLAFGAMVRRLPLLAGLVFAGIAHGFPLYSLAGAVAKAPIPISVPKPPLVIEHVIELPPEPPPPAPAPVPEAAPAPRPVHARAMPPAAPSPTSAPAASAPAMTGEVVTAAATDAPLDLTGFDLVSGSGSHFAGGRSSAEGTSTRAVHSEEVDPHGVPDGRGTSRAREVGLSAGNWRCQWPREADALGIDEQLVVLRAVVRADGSAASVELLADPGHGFGEAALGCARTARFEPARDEHGIAYAATSAPIRVRFTR